MSLPDGFLDELRTRTSLAHVVGRKVMWDQRKSNQAKGDLWAPCPFHHEKTASFHVDDRKGFYYCFGCHQKGDAISFVRETENVGFMEAVEILAREAGLQMPARDPEAQKKADRRTELAEVMEQAVQYYRLQLRTGAGTAAREYLVGRGIKEAALDRWEIGFAPPGWQNVRDHLTAKGISDDILQAVGLTRASDKGRDPYDVFRNRIMFPIRDARGRAIAFGGRAMDPADPAKYLNSPETELFDKGRNLFNFGPAREATGKGKTLVIAEGYMDVIALSEAGFQAAVAPLGTAVTEDQLALIWRIASEPVVALDGDRAGIEAAYRLVDLALPRIAAGQSLRFALMPEKQDPDDVIRAGGAAAMEKILEASVPMVTLLWRRETEGKVFDSPERKSSLDKALREQLKEIKDPSLRRHYGEEVDALRRALYRGNREDRRGWRPGGRGAAPAHPSASARSSLLAAGSEGVADALREAVILATLIRHPVLIDRFLSDLEHLGVTRPEHEAARGALLRLGPEAETEEIERDLGPEVLEKLRAPRHVQIAPGPGPDPDKAEMCLAEEFAKLTASRGAARDIEDALHDFGDLADEGLTWRLSQAAEARNRAVRAGQDDKTEFDIADNGMRLEKAQRSESRALFESIDFSKGGQKNRGANRHKPE